MYLLTILSILFELNTAASNLTATYDILYYPQFQAVTVNDFVDEDLVEIFIEGPGDVWVGIGFGGDSMENTYAIICSEYGDDAKCQENLLAMQGCGRQLTPQIEIINYQFMGGQRYVHLNRKRVITSNDTSDYKSYYDFPSAPREICVISGLGKSNTFLNISNSGDCMDDNSVSCAVKFSAK
eukprot:387363_1